MRQALTISQGNWATFFTRPISGTLMVVAIALLVIPNLLRVIRSRKAVA